MYEFRALEGLCVGYDGPITGWSKVEKIVSSVKCHLKKRSIVSTLEGGPQSAHWKPVSVKCLSRV